jgi:transcriptional regulator with XRE-family HTH domain
MNATGLRAARSSAGMSQALAAKRLGVTQSYLSLLERGKRRVPARLAAKAATLFRANPLLLPLTPWHEWVPREVSNQWLAEQLALLGYPGFAYMRSRLTRVHPADLLMTGLSQPVVEPRVMEGLFWSLTKYWQMDRTWLVQVAKLHGLQNKLGFAAELCSALMLPAETRSNLYRLAVELAPVRLADEAALCDKLSSSQERWYRENRGPRSSKWNLVTNWEPEHLQNVA